jgi:hypothetical protein
MTLFSRVGAIATKSKRAARKSKSGATKSKSSASNSKSLSFRVLRLLNRLSSFFVEFAPEILPTGLVFPELAPRGVGSFRRAGKGIARIPIFIKEVHGFRSLPGAATLLSPVTPSGEPGPAPGHRRQNDAKTGFALRLLPAAARKGLKRSAAAKSDYRTGMAPAGAV